MIQPQPFNIKCPKCGKTKKVSPKIDSIDIRDVMMVKVKE